MRKRIHRLVLFAFAAVLLAFLAAWWITHDGPEGNGTKPPSVHVE